MPYPSDGIEWRCYNLQRSMRQTEIDPTQSPDGSLDSACSSDSCEHSSGLPWDRLAIKIVLSEYRHTAAFEGTCIGPMCGACSTVAHTPASTLTIRQPKPNRWFNVGPTATYLVGPTLLCSLDKRWPNINCQPKPNQAPTITQHCPNYHQP